MKRNVLGRGQNSIGFNQVGADQAGAILVTNGTPGSLPSVNVHDMDGISFELTTAAGTRTITVIATDAVVGGTKIWTFANGAFTADDVGGTITVAGATNGANNGTFTISAQTPTTVTTGGAPVNETFTTPTNLIVTSTGAAITAGVWTIQGSNTFASSELNQVDAPGTWSDITTSFTTIAAVTGNGQTRLTMSTIPILSVRSVRPLLTLGAAGRTRANAFMCAKGGG